MTAALTADFKTEPYLHQLREFETSADLPARALLWQMRTGKTKVVIDTACHLAREGRIDAVLVFAPNGVHENWLLRELPIHHWNTVPHDALAWRTSVAGTAAGEHVSSQALPAWQQRHDAWWALAKSMLKDERLAWFAFNDESMTRKDCRRLIARILKRRRVLLVADECDDFRTPGSKRTRMARSLAPRCGYRRILTGSSVTNSPLHAFSQFELLGKAALGFEKYADFKAHHARYKLVSTRGGRQYPKLDEYVNLEELRERMARWSSVVLRDDCPDLPDLVPTTRRIELTDEQLRLYRELHSQFVLELDGEEVSIGEKTTKLVKLQQVVSGFLIDEFGDVHDVPGINPRLEALADEVYMAPGRVIVWCQFREDIDRVVARLTADGHDVLQYHGRVSDDDKATVRRLFAADAESERKIHLVGQPSAGGRGVDLSAADEIVWCSHTFSAITRVQADERATAMMGSNVRVTNLVAPGVDEYMRATVTDNVVRADMLAGAGMREILKQVEI